MQEDNNSHSNSDYNTIFDRQVRIDGWKQHKLKEQVALILGVGGLGSIIMIDLLRLGIKRIYIVDYDVVDLHNINRQLLYTQKDVGMLKVNAAKLNSTFFNVAGTEIIESSIDAAKHWPQIVEMAKQSHVVFNCIDYGDYWDAAVQSLCLSLRLPHIIGGTFAQMLMAEIYLSQPCYACLDDMLKPDLLSRLTPSLIQTLTSVDFLPKNNKPVGQSHIALCSTSGNFVTQHFLNYVNEEEGCNRTKKIIFYMTTFECVQFDLQANPHCVLCGTPPQEKQQDQID